MRHAAALSLNQTIKPFIYKSWYLLAWRAHIWQVQERLEETDVCSSKAFRALQKFRGAAACVGSCLSNTTSSDTVFPWKLLIDFQKHKSHQTHRSQMFVYWKRSIFFLPSFQESLKQRFQKGGSVDLHNNERINPLWLWHVPAASKRSIHPFNEEISRESRGLNNCRRML